MVIIDQVTIKPMRLDDIDSVLEIERMSFTTPWARDAYLHELKDNRRACYLVAWEFHRVLGDAGMWVVLDEAHVTTIAVDPLHRWRRIGKRLLAALIGEARRRRARRVTLEVRKSNIGAQSVYRKYGFKDIGIRKGYDSDNREDAIVMWTGNLWEQAFQERYRKNRASLDSPSA